MLHVPPHRARQCHAFNVAPDRRQLIRRHAVIHALHFLLDDRPFVEVRRHVMCSRANQLNATIERLVIRLGAFEARQERVVNIDGSVAIRILA
jgi:hypothetical protein